MPSLLLCQVKCDQYWPSRGTETYGMIQVTMLDTVDLATYSVRTFALYKVQYRLVICTQPYTRQQDS